MNIYTLVKLDESMICLAESLDDLRMQLKGSANMSIMKFAGLEETYGESSYIATVKEFNLGAVVKWMVFENSLGF